MIIREAVRYNFAMSDLFFYDSLEDVPVPRPRAEMRFETATVVPYPDGRRVKLAFQFPPFQERPNVEAWVTDTQGRVTASMSLIEAMEQDFDFTLHLRGPEPQGEHTLRLVLYYLAAPDRFEERQVVDERTLTFTIEPPR